MAEALMIVAYTLACIVGVGFGVGGIIVSLAIFHESNQREAVRRHAARHEAEK